MLPHFAACCDKSCRTICWLPRLPSPICHATLCAHLKLSGKKYGTTFYLLWSIFCVLTHTHAHAHWPALGAGADFLYCCCCCCHVVVAVVVICLDFLLFICCIKQNKSNLIYSCTTHTHTLTHAHRKPTHTHPGTSRRCCWQLTVPVYPLAPSHPTGHPPLPHFNTPHFAWLRFDSHIATASGYAY